MAERSAERPTVCLEFAFDRLLPIKLQQVYGLLVANCVRPVGQSSEEIRGDGREACSDLRQGLIGQTEGRTHHCEKRKLCEGSPDSRASACPMNG
jgi:hypothetical protein